MHKWEYFYMIYPIVLHSQVIKKHTMLQVILNVLQNKMHYYSHIIITENQTNYATLCILAISGNVHILCCCRKQSLPYCWLQMIYNWANNWANDSLTSRGYEQHVHKWLHAALSLISKQVHNNCERSCCKTVHFKVNGTDPYGNGLFAYRPTAALIGYGTPVCVEYGSELCLSMQ